MPVVLASDIMDGAAVVLNDTARNLYTNAVQLPLLKQANESIEQELAAYGIRIQRTNSAAIAVASSTTPNTLTLPSDFLIPITLWERPSGSTSEGDYIPLQKLDSLVGMIPTTTLGVWAFYNNAVNFPGCSQNVEVKMEYERMLAVITGANSPEDTYILKNYLIKKTAELCARFIGMNTEFADEILTRETTPALNNLITIFVRDMQSVRHRKGSFSNARYIGVVIRG